jgi:hypothetical protein
MLDPPLPVGENAEILGTVLHMRTPGGETGQVISYAKSGKFTRELLIDDDLGSVVRTQNAAGRENARVIGDLVYAKLTGSDTMQDGYQLFDNTNHGNVAATAGAPAVATVDSVNEKIAAQQGPANQYLNLSCKILLGPPSMRAALAYLVATLNGSGVQDFIALTDSRLSGVAWYGLEDPQITPAIEVVSLEGGNGPQRFEMVKIQGDGMRFRYGLDVAVVLTDYKPICKNAGA